MQQNVRRLLRPGTESPASDTWHYNSVSLATVAGNTLSPYTEQQQHWAVIQPPPRTKATKAAAAPAPATPAPTTTTTTTATTTTTTTTATSGTTTMNGR